MTFSHIPPEMPERPAADLMVRRGECPNFFRAIAIVQARRSRHLGQVEIKPTFDNVERPAKPFWYQKD